MLKTQFQLGLVRFIREMSRDMNALTVHDYLKIEKTLQLDDGSVVNIKAEGFAQPSRQALIRLTMQYVDTNNIVHPERIGQHVLSLN